MISTRIFIPGFHHHSFIPHNPTHPHRNTPNPTHAPQASFSTIPANRYLLHSFKPLDVRSRLTSPWDLKSLPFGHGVRCLKHMDLAQRTINRRTLTYTIAFVASLILYLKLHYLAPVITTFCAFLSAIRYLNARLVATHRFLAIAREQPARRKFIYYFTFLAALTFIYLLGLRFATLALLACNLIYLRCVYF
ncbi:hypothetical protein BYT27DRAFT_7261833 [Phlegmacium glaucopus]|nr:hypothetical protein BYT27DRAFT_7261833 [Phlegmacium glaucopus]